MRRWSRLGRLKPAAMTGLCAVVVILATLIVCAEGDGAIISIPGSYLQSNFTVEPISVLEAARGCQAGLPPVPLVEATISSVHAAFQARRLTCKQLVDAYTQRILAFDRMSGMNSIRALNPNLQQDAATLDDTLSQVLAGSQTMPKLLCVPLLVKDNYDTVGMAASNGAVGLLDNFPARDAHQIQLLKAQGAIVLAKTNMAEWAFSPDISTGSAFGVVRNPYATDFSTAGSSGGTAAGLAANLGLVGLGTDTGNSIRGPAGWNSLVGIRPSLGLSSRAGLIPLDLTSDVGGPLARTVEDAARLLEVTAGVDPSDNLTAIQRNYSVPGNYTQFLRAGALAGMRIGVMRQILEPAQANPLVTALFDRALADLATAGATVVDNFTIAGNSLGSSEWDGGATWPTGYGNNAKDEQLDCGARFKPDVNAYLASAGSRFKTVQDLVMHGQYHPSANASMMIRLAIPYLPSQYPPPQLRSQGYICNCDEFFNNPCRMEFRQRLVQSMDQANVSVIVFPTWSNLPPLVGDYGQPDGNNSPQISPPTGAPAMVVPMGFSSAAPLGPPLPASLQFLARPFDEGTLIAAAYSYEQATRHRRPPPAFPECTAPMAPATAPGLPVSGLGAAALQPSNSSLG